MSLSHSHRGIHAPAGAGNDGTTTKAAQGVSALCGILGETKRSNSTSEELVQTPRVCVKEEVCPTKLTWSSHLDVRKGC